MQRYARHEHIFLFGESSKDPLRPLGDIVAQRLADGYRCICLIHDHDYAIYRASLNAAGIDVDGAQVRNQLACIALSAVLEHSADAVDATRELLSQECAVARDAGLAGSIFWLDMEQRPFDRIPFKTIEAWLHDCAPNDQLSVFYLFKQSESPPGRIVDALHEIPLIYDEQRVRPNPYYQQPLVSDARDHPDELLDRILVQLRAGVENDATLSEPSFAETSLLDAFPDPYFTVDNDLRFVAINATARRLWSRASDELIGTRLWDAFPDAIGIFGYDQIEGALNDRIPRQFEIDSSYLGYWTEVRVLPFREGLAITYRDISQRKTTESALANRARQQAVVVELGQLALNGLNYERLLRETVTAIRSTLDVDYVSVFEYAPSEQLFNLVAGSGWPERMIGNFRLLPGTASLAGFTLLVGEPVIVEDLTQETRFSDQEFLVEHGVRSSVGLVIGGQAQPYGVLAAHTRQMMRFSQDDVNFLQAIANILATAFDRHHTEQLLRHHAAIVTSSEDAIIGETLEGIISSWNGGAERMFGYSEAEVIGQPITIIYPPDQHAGAYEVLDRVKQGQRIDQMETIRQRKNGELFDVSISVSPILDTNGMIIGAAKFERDISDRTRAEAERRASEERLQLALDAGKMGTWDWEIASGTLDWSPNMVEMHGLKPEDFRGRFEDFAERVHPDDRDRVLGQVRAALESGGVFQTEYRNLRPDGVAQWLEARGRVSHGRLGQPDHMSGVCIDVTEQVRLRQQIARFAAATVAERDQLQQVIDVIPEGVVIVNSEGQIGMSNEAARKIWGGQLSDIDLRAHYERPQDSTGPSRFSDLPIWRSIVTGEFVLGEQITVERGGSRQPIQLLLNSAPLRDEQGRITAAVSTFQDITAIKDFERQKDEFLQTISHDLKNPLTSVKGNAQLLKRRARNADLDIIPIVERIEGSTDQASALIDELLDITRLQMGRPLDLVRKPTPVNELVRRIVEEFRATSDPHRFRIDAHSELIIGLIDELRIARVISNLLSNAVKYSDPGSEILVTTSISRFHNGWLEISVHDHGIGIPASDIPQLFQRFRRGSNVIGQIRGSGLGLASSKQIVEQHGGTIHVETVEGRGSTFTVRLPLAEISDGVGSTNSD